MQDRRNVSVKVWGDYALFTRPEFKVERVSYPLLTPSAARGLLEAIFWKPEIRYEVRTIDVLKIGGQMAIMRNEISDKQGNNPITVDASKQRQQRSSIILRDVAYVIGADILLRPWANEPILKYSEQFTRRVEMGKFHHTPCLGTREFAAGFAIADAGERAAALDLDFGRILFDVARVEDPNRPEITFRRHGPGGSRSAIGYWRPLFFNARLDSGRCTVPEAKYQELYELEGLGA